MTAYHDEHENEYDLRAKQTATSEAKDDLVARAREEAAYLESENVSPLSTPTTLRDCADRIASLAEQVEMLTKGGIIEVAIRNVSVADYMNHWEGRAEAAEAQVQKLREALERFDRVLDFVRRWAWRPLLGRGPTDAERLSAIKYHPAIKLAATLSNTREGGKDE